MSLLWSGTRRKKFRFHKRKKPAIDLKALSIPQWMNLTLFFIIIFIVIFFILNSFNSHDKNQSRSHDITYPIPIFSTNSQINQSSPFTESHNTTLATVATTITVPTTVHPCDPKCSSHSNLIVLQDFRTGGFNDRITVIKGLNNLVGGRELAFDNEFYRIFLWNLIFPTPSIFNTLRNNFSTSTMRNFPHSTQL